MRPRWKITASPYGTPNSYWVYERGWLFWHWHSVCGSPEEARATVRWELEHERARALFTNPFKPEYF